MQTPMISAPLKATNEIDWIQPLKTYIQDTYGDDPERYAEECATLNRLRQDMRGAGRDSAAGRDLLYRYYGQLELLDLRFPVDENHIKISFTWFDAFTHKATAQYSLAFEKASIIFNISAVLSCHAAQQTRSEDSGLKTAYHSFQASAGMFTYINENFLHAPSTDLSRDTVKTLIQIMLAQGQEVFLEKQIADGKKVGLLAKLASQANYMYSQALEGTQDNVNRAIFEKVWLLIVQIKAAYMNSLAQYYQGLAEDDANSHGSAIARLQIADAAAREANKLSKGFPNSVPANSNLTVEAGLSLADITKRHLASVQSKLIELLKDNDYIYHQTVPAEASLSIVPKLPASKAIPVSELYAGQDIQRITGPDIFQKIVPLAVTESASLYDEEKAKLVRAETERVESANSEMAASLDYLRLPGALQILKGGLDQDSIVSDEFRSWCEDMAANQAPSLTFDSLRSRKETIVAVLDRSNKQLDMEESVCEKMRSKYEGEWTQQPSARLTTTLKSDMNNYRGALDEAARSDGQLYQRLKLHGNDFDQMRSAGELGEVDILLQNALSQVGSRAKTSPGSSHPREGSLLDADFGDNSPSVMDQVTRVEEILKKLNLIKKERAQVLKDLKEKIHNDDISQVLILNKKSIANYENQLFQAELEKFRPHQNRLVAANHKQSSLMKELTATFNILLQDKRVRAEQSRYESATRQRSLVMSKYKRIFQEFLDLEAGLEAAKQWYDEMKDTVGSLEKNVETFVNNRRAEGSQLLAQIEQDRASSASGRADMERERMRELMERMSMEPSTSNNHKQGSRSNLEFQQPASPTTRYPATNLAGQYQVANPSHNSFHNHSLASQPKHNSGPVGGYNPGTYSHPNSPPPNQTSFSQNQHNYAKRPPQQQQPTPPQPQYIPPGYVPPPPPPGPPPLGPQQTIQPPGSPPLAGHGEYGYPLAQKPSRTTADPWAGLNAWR